MAKLRGPLLSLGASGSIGDCLTLQRRMRTTSASKYNPKGPHSTENQKQVWWAFYDIHDRWKRMQGLDWWKASWDKLSQRLPEAGSGYHFWIAALMRACCEKVTTGKWIIDPTATPAYCVSSGLDGEGRYVFQLEDCRTGGPCVDDALFDVLLWGEKSGSKVIYRMQPDGNGRIVLPADLVPPSGGLLSVSAAETYRSGIYEVE